MSRRSTVECWLCHQILVKDEREHYAYQCSACTLREHDFVQRWLGGDDHPELDIVFEGPVDTGLARPSSAAPAESDRAA